MTDQEMIKLASKAKILGILKVIETYCGNKCYLISKSKEEHLLLIPSNVRRLNNSMGDVNEFCFTKHISKVLGTLKVIGGLGLLDCTAMFRLCNFTELDLSELDTSEVLTMSEMFRNSRIKNLILGDFNTFYVEDMSYMFSDCIIPEINLSTFSTYYVKDMGYMFDHCSTYDLIFDSFNTASVTDMECMFNECSARLIDLSSFSVTDRVCITNMFTNCSGDVRISNHILYKEYIYREQTNW